jgi:hypothetical protein
MALGGIISAWSSVGQAKQYPEKLMRFVIDKSTSKAAQYDDGKVARKNA